MSLTLSKFFILCVATAVGRDAAREGGVVQRGARSFEGGEAPRSALRARRLDVRTRVPTGYAKLTADDAARYDDFGCAVAISGDLALVGANQGSIDKTGAAYVFENSGGSWSQAVKLVADDGFGGDYFGFSVGIDGDLAVVGAPNDDDDEGSYNDNFSGRNSGSAYLFGRSNDGSWSQLAKLIADDAAPGDGFGISVGISGDLAVVGAPFDNESGDFSGSAYIFGQNDDGSWSQVAKLVADDTAANDRFGRAVAISGDMALVGAWLADEDGAADYNSGSAYLFGRDSGGSWSKVAKLVADDAARIDGFGRAVAISGDLAVVGAASDSGAGPGSGAAYIFGRTGDSTWSQEAKLVADDGAALDYFGEAVAIDSDPIDGDLAVIGAYWDDDGGSRSTYNSGSAYVFARGNGGSWSQVAKLVAADPAEWDWFGLAVGISGDVAVIGALGDDCADGSDMCGSASVFAKNATDGTWPRAPTTSPTASPAASPTASPTDSTQSPTKNSDAAGRGAEVAAAALAALGLAFVL